MTSSDEERKAAEKAQAVWFLVGPGNARTLIPGISLRPYRNREAAECAGTRPSASGPPSKASSSFGAKKSIANAARGIGLPDLKIAIAHAVSGPNRNAASARGSGFPASSSGFVSAPLFF